MKLLILAWVLASQPPPPDECADYPKMLRSCTAHACKITHPLTQTRVEKRIVGIVGGKCRTTEEMPNNGKMTCNLSEERRQAIAGYLEQMTAASNVRMQAKISIKSGKETTKLTVDGKEVKDLLREALNDGACVVTGY